MPNVFLTFEIPQITASMLRKKGYKVVVNSSGKNLTKQELKEVFSEYDAVLTLMTDKIDSEVIDAASPKLKIIANYAVGFDNIDVLEAKRKGIVVTNTPGVAGESVAEHTFALILSCAKKIVIADKFTRSGKYHRWDPMAFMQAQIWGKTIGIVGLGRIGTYVGQIASGGFRMKILYCDVVRAEDFELLTEAQRVDLSTLLRQSDVITIHVPLTEKTQHLIGKEELKLMKESAILINTSRGAVVDEEALIETLSEKKIAGAGLDVYEHEPHVPHGLTTLGNVVLTPHIASATIETREAMARISAENIIAVFEGKNPEGIIKVD